MCLANVPSGAGSSEGSPALPAGSRWGCHHQEEAGDLEGLTGKDGWVQDVGRHVVWPCPPSPHTPRVPAPRVTPLGTPSPNLPWLASRAGSHGAARPDTTDGCGPSALLYRAPEPPEHTRAPLKRTRRQLPRQLRCSGLSALEPQILRLFTHTKSGADREARRGF